MKQSLEFEPLENRVAPILVSAPAPEQEPEPGGGGGTTSDYPVQTPQPKHWNPGWMRKTPV